MNSFHILDNEVVVCLKVNGVKLYEYRDTPINLQKVFDAGFNSLNLSDKVDALYLRHVIMFTFFELLNALIAKDIPPFGVGKRTLEWERTND